MSKRIVRICYRKIINIGSQGTWEKLVFKDTYNEFLMQFQFYNGEKKYQTFSSLINENPAADRLHFLVAAAATGYVAQLKGKIPDVQNTLGKIFLTFHNFRFEIIDSNILDESGHYVAINFYSDKVEWLDTVDDMILLTSGKTDEQGAVLTDMLKLQPYISVCSVKNAG